MKLLSKRVSFICLGMMATGLMQAQAQSKIKFRLPTLGVHAGSLSFPTGHAPENWSLTNARPGYSFELNEQFSNSFSASFSFLTGSLAGTGTSADPHLSFESKINLGGLNFYYHFANDVLIKSTAVVNPYFGAGIGFLSYKTFADLKDNAGNTYYYWSDGSIRNIDEHDDQAYSALKIKKDKIAETPLQSLPVNGKLHPTTSLAIPLHAGLKFSIAPSLKFDLGASYYFTMTDWLDNMTSTGVGYKTGNTAKSQFLFLHVGLCFNFGKNESGGEGGKNQDAYANINFKLLDQQDEDKDGVVDSKDKCPATLPNSKVDANGCQYDDDKDGVPNEIDKETKTKPGATVDANGVAVVKNAKIQAAEASERMTPVPVSANGKIVTSTMPAAYRWADADGDGKISQAEISLAIDRFFDDGGKEITNDQIMKLIDFFFEQ